MKIKIYRTISLPVVLCGCETWSVALKVEHRRRVFENRALRKIFGPERDGITREWRRLHNKELCYLYSSSNIIRMNKTGRLKWTEHFARLGERRGAYRVLVGRPDGKR
jgi:hypothetical protein